MKAELFSFVLLALQNSAFTYGHGEWSCSNGPCIVGVSQTASGEILSENVPSAAMPMPLGSSAFVPFWIKLKTKNGPCVKVRVNDRTSPRLFGKRGFDLSPSALKALTGIVSKKWSGKLYLCEDNMENKHKYEPGTIK